MARHCRDTLWLGTAGTLGDGALQGCLVARHCRDTWWLGSAGTLGGWGTAGMLCGWALQSGSGRRARTTQTLKSNSPSVRVGNNPEGRMPKMAMATTAVARIAECALCVYVWT